MSLWRITTIDGEIIEENAEAGLFWPDVPFETRIARLEVAGHAFEGFDEYGFQRIGGAPVGSDGPLMELGFQVLCKSEVGVVLWTLENGRCHTKMVPINQVTYNPELWRKGARDG